MVPILRSTEDRPQLGTAFSDMNSSYPPVADRSWAVAVPAHFAHKPSALCTTAPSDFDEQHQQQANPDLYGCQSCGKNFPRFCDLNRHLKTHSRSFKCPVKDCPYSTLGWSTETELERHFNDKHSSEPRTFPCLWHGCKYVSKRESNRRQHMEKVHGYNYVRGRADKTSAAARATSIHRSAQLRNPLAARGVPNLLLTPDPLAHRPQQLPPDASSPLSISGPISFSSDLYMPWTPQIARLESDTSLLQDLSQACAPGTPITMHDGEWLRVPLDPRLYNPSPCGTTTPETSPVTEGFTSHSDMLRALPTIVTPRTSPSMNSQVLTPVSEPSPVAQQHVAFARGTTSTQDSEEPAGRSSSTAAQGLMPATHLNPFGKRHVHFDRDAGEDSDAEDEPPAKRSKTPGGTEEESGDPKMICPFRRANPRIYDLNEHPKYFSCHTEHHNISTVVRHLGRPAHNLYVDNNRQAISSFNVSDNEHGHPAAGLCKKCWRSFSDPEAFDNHFNTKCETVSRSKREKFQILLDTFCRIDQSGDNDGSGDEEDANDEEDSDPNVQAAETSHFHAGDLVSRREYQALADRVATLERMWAASMPQSTPRTLPQHSAVIRAFTPSSAMPPQSHDYYSYDVGPGALRTSISSSSRTNMAAGVETQPLSNTDPTVVTGFYQDNDRSVASYQPAISGHGESIAAVRQAGTLGSTTSLGGSRAVVHDTPYGTADTAGASRVTGNSAIAQLSSNRPPEAFHSAVAAGAASASAAVEVSQQAPNTMVSQDRWHQGMPAGGGMMQRMDFFGGQTSTEDLTNYLNMETQ
ncbi:hypothetical protein BD289DRAFT_131229 [Coniella lustricola]|uniref:C2H2-type domain-containing protein n=1 Tax=Coniella lustricola TaxID=2025994 RepID=A0A2T3AFV0_9PEZI|nr:hypothetical protein BD289DRAFT_131229 [Coniella lustricola]